MITHYIFYFVGKDTSTYEHMSAHDNIDMNNDL